MRARVSNISFILLLFLSPSLAWAELVFEQSRLTLNKTEYRIEIADTSSRRTQGLMYRKSIGEYDGMLFIFDSPGTHRIWMKNTPIPLTVLWLDEQARIVGIKSLKPCSRMSCPVFGDEFRSRYVLELHDSARERFQIGQRLPGILDMES
jgi:uncharacterized membrane protein (UPF0127 family)